MNNQIKNHANVLIGIVISKNSMHGMFIMSNIHIIVNNFLNILYICFSFSCLHYVRYNNKFCTLELIGLLRLYYYSILRFSYFCQSAIYIIYPTFYKQLFRKIEPCLVKVSIAPQKIFLFLAIIIIA